MRGGGGQDCMAHRDLFARTCWKAGYTVVLCRMWLLSLGFPGVWRSRKQLPPPQVKVVIRVVAPCIAGSSVLFSGRGGEKQAATHLASRCTCCFVEMSGETGCFLHVAPLEGHGPGPVLPTFGKGYTKSWYSPECLRIEGVQGFCAPAVSSVPVQGGSPGCDFCSVCLLGQPE